MRSFPFLITLSVFALPLSAQTSYSGFIDTNPIELVTNINTGGEVWSVFVNTNNDEPIVLSGTLRKGMLILNEKDYKGIQTSTLTFESFDETKQEIEGLRLESASMNKQKISLHKNFSTETGNEIEWRDREIIQPVTLDNKYFRLIISKTKGEFYARASGIKIFEKKTDKLIQKVDFNCELHGLENVEIGDYNFDGHKDFSVFESSYAGPNTSRKYFLYDPKANKYFDSGFKGISLEFNEKSKRISEHNQSKAGKQHTTATYKVVNNKMVLLEQHCLIWDEKKQDLVERDLKDCQ